MGGNEKASDRCCNSAGGMDPTSKGRDVTHLTGKYADYTTTVRDDWGSCCIEPFEATGEMVKYHYRIFRVPAQKLFVLKHCADATDADRAAALRMLATMPSGGWERWAPYADEGRNPSTGTRYWRVLLGTFLDDPLLRLELAQLSLDLDNLAALSALGSLRQDIAA